MPLLANDPPSFGFQFGNHLWLIIPAIFATLYFALEVFEKLYTWFRGEREHTDRDTFDREVRRLDSEDKTNEARLDAQQARHDAAMQAVYADMRQAFHSLETEMRNSAAKLGELTGEIKHLGKD